MSKLLPSIDRPLDRLISESATATILNISSDTLRRLGKRGEGPKRRKISPRRVGYKLSDVEAYSDGIEQPTQVNRLPLSGLSRKSKVHRSR